MKKNYEGLSIVGKTIIVLIALIKSLFFAITNVAWGLVSIFALNIIINYFIKEGTPLYISETFLMLESFIAEHIMLFVLVFFLLYSYIEIKEVFKR